jgi:hypothetical protein
MSETTAHDMQWMAKHLDFLEDLQRHLDERSSRINEIGLAIVAEDVVRLFGRRAQIAVTWPDGPPFGDADSTREWAREQLAELRRRG